MSLSSQISKILDILRRDQGLGNPLHVVEQVSWILFLKYLDSLDTNGRQLTSQSDSVPFLNKKYRWSNLAYFIDSNSSATLTDFYFKGEIVEYVDQKLFPYLRSFSETKNEFSFAYNVGSIFRNLCNHITSNSLLRDVLRCVNEVEVKTLQDEVALGNVFESLLTRVNDAKIGGEFYTPRSLISTVVKVIDPQLGERIYDPAAGSGGFLIGAFSHIKKISNTPLHKDYGHDLSNAFFGNEISSLSYSLGMIDMIIHGITTPNVRHSDALKEDLRKISNDDRYDIILSNPPFGGKYKPPIPKYFPVESVDTSLLFIQHIMELLSKQGRAAVIMPVRFLWEESTSCSTVRARLVKKFNLHTILNLPPGVFQPSSGVKCSVLFFDRIKPTKEIWFYDFAPHRKLSKLNPLQEDDLDEFVRSYKTRKTTDHSWSVAADMLGESHNLSPINPAKEGPIKSPQDILEEIKSANVELADILRNIESILGR